MFVVFCVGSGLCDELSTCPEDPYRVCVCVCVCDLETAILRWSEPELGFWATEITKELVTIEET